VSLPPTGGANVAESSSSSTGVGGASTALGGVDRRAVGTLALVASLAVAADALTKQWALAGLAHGPVRLLGGALYLSLTRNSGAAFSIGGRFTFIFPIVALAVIAVIIWLATRLRSVPWAIALGLIMGGAAGNLVDRLLRAPGPLRGHVVDFLSLFDAGGRVWPIFNLADSALFCGVALAIALEFTGRHRDGSRHVGGGGGNRSATLRS
jgi:signal peptidase II